MNIGKFIVQRLKSNTYRVALVGLAVSAVEANSGLLLSGLAPALKPYAVMLWPIAMMTLRELTTKPLAEK